MSNEHEHDHDCDCGCNHEEEYDTIFLTLDDDTEVECNVLGVFEVDGKEYIAVLPITDDTVLIYKYAEDGDDIILDVIEDDEEFEKVSEVFYDEFGEEDEEEE